MKKSKGFTLIELLVVIAIIGILASVVLASLNRARRQGRDARRVSDIKQIQLAEELFFDANAEYSATIAALAPTYIATEPKDPSTQASYAYADLNIDGSGNRVACDTASAVCAYYHLGTKLEDVTNAALKSDRDGDGVVDGGPDGLSTAAACAVDAAATTATDLCYDVTP